MSSSRRNLSVFLFHDVNDEPSQFGVDYNLTVSQDLFKKQISWIKSKYTVVSPIDLLHDEPLPLNPALITFDDGFEGAFENGIKYLDEQGLPSLVFLNMGNILNNAALISSIGTFLERNEIISNSLLQDLGLEKPYHLNLNPTILEKIRGEIIKFDMSEIQKYQGKIASVETLKKWEDCKNVFYGNHLYEHYNVAALSTSEFKELVIKNNSELKEFNNSLKFFSFPNGQPELCFNSDDVDLLKELGLEKVFFSSGAVNSIGSDFLLNRMDLTTYEYNTLKLNYRVKLTQYKKKNLKRVSGLLRRFV